MTYLESTKLFKRDSRMARERSEDTLTWNVFRYLEKKQLRNEAIERFIRDVIEESELIFFFYFELEGGTLSLLKEERRTFQESTGTEPDIIIDSKEHIIFIEVKFTSGNRIKPKG